MGKDRLKVKKLKSNLNRERGLIMATGAERALPLIQWVKQRNLARWNFVQAQFESG